MRKNKLFIFMLAFILSISCLSTIAFSHSNTQSSDDTELNWYFVNRGKDTLPECPKEATGLLSKYDAYYLGDTNEKVIYLTFDEGYENGYTPKILDVLKEENVPAAFFVVKPYITQNPEIIKRMADEGHLVCNHSNHHPSMATITDLEKFKAEFTDVEEAYKEIVGTDMPKFFRPPMGKYSINSLKKTKDLGYKTIFWSFAYKDWIIDNQPSEEEAIKNFRPPMGKYSINSLKKTKDLGYKTIFWSFAYKDWIIDNQPSEEEAIKKITNGVHPGCIMLIHAVSKTNTAVLKTVLEQIKADGYEFKSLNELPDYQ